MFAQFSTNDAFPSAMCPIITRWYNMSEISQVFFSCFVVNKQRPDPAYHEAAKLALQERGQSSAYESADFRWAPVSAASLVPAGDRTGSEPSTGALGQSLSKEAALQPDAFFHEGTPQSDSIPRRLHQTSPSSAIGSSFILVRITFNPLLSFLYTVVSQLQVC